MTEMVLIWLVVPALLLLLSYSYGLGLSLLTRKPLNFAIATTVGFSIIIILGSLLTISTVTAPYCALIIGAIGGLGLLLSLVAYRSYFRMDYQAGIAGFITYVVFGLPVIAYGHPSWAGWIKLDDNGTFLAVTDRLMNVGRTVPDVVLSTYDRVLQTIFAGSGSSHFSYPVGTFMPLGVISKLTGTETAWFYQPYMSFAAGLVAMLFVLILRRYFESNVAHILISVLSVMASTLYSYVMWGAVKEIVIIVPLALFSLTLFTAIKSRSNKESYLFAGIGAVALFFVGGTASLGFIAPVIFAAILVRIYSKNKALALGILGSFTLLAIGVTYYLKTSNGALGNILIPIIGDTGNLGKPLSLAQLVGIWPSQDFRLNPVHPLLTYPLIATAFIFTVTGIYYSLKRSLWVVPSTLMCCIAVVASSYFWGGIWITGKAIAIASPFFILAAGVGSYEFWLRSGKSRLRWVQEMKLQYVVLVLASAVGVGVVVSDFYTYKNVWLAPYSQINELRTIGKLYAGQGPALMTEYSVYGARYFLRDLSAESVSELRVHEIPMRDGNQAPKGFAADIDLFNNSTIDYFNLLVLRKSPTASRPPLNYKLAWSGSHYEVWKRTPQPVVIESTLPLGSNFSPATTPSCDQVSSFLSGLTKDERVYAAYRNKDYMINFAEGDLPPTWYPTSPFSGGVDRLGSGGFSRTFTLDETRNYNLSIAGNFPGRLSVQVDGVQVFSGKSVFESNTYLTNPIGRVRLSAGLHTLTLLYSKPPLMSGGDSDSRFGPIYISSQNAGDVKVSRVSISKIAQLCTRNLDWIAIAR